MTPFMDGPAELADQQHAVPRPVPGQHDDGVAQVIAFAVQVLPFAVAAPIFEIRPAQDVVIVGKELHLLKPHALAGVFIRHVNSCIVVP